ncbi:MAG: NTP transferase domain-containing protein [Deltaproteobacteria bacterium]|nr:NTP transferase domain-containing protein [Deltaproteobacteria bacterium]MDQ3296240.1 sugar phosphate nucleotidyltransferase [Myxococcota bacterium]
MWTTDSRSLRASQVEPTDDDSPDLDWTLALAGGEGMRLTEYVERRFGRRIPKQYCCLLGNRSMIQHTLERLNKITPASRTMTVIGTHHGDVANPQLAGRCDHVFTQPSARDTGLALYVALAMIKRWNPNALVTITPTDHYVAPAAKYVDQVRAAQGVARQIRDKVVILGVRPTEPDPELGYLSLGAQITEVPQVRQLVGFVEKPSVSVCQKLREQGALWNTMVTCGTVEALWELGRASEPQLMDILDSLVPLIGSADEADAIQYIYRAYLPVSFSRDMLERAPERLCAMELEGVEWSDWGKPERIETVLALRRSRALVPIRALAP